MTHHIYLVDDDQLVLSSLKRVLQKSNYQYDCFTSADEALNKLTQSQKLPDAIISDQRMPKLKGTDFALELKQLEKTKSIPIIILSAYSDFQDITKAFNDKLIDLFLTKPWSNKDLLSQLELVITNKSTTVDNTYATGFHNLYGESAVMQSLYQLITKAAQTESSVILRGETGTGKELIAQAIHYENKQQTKPIISINCANIHQDLFESQLFGYKKGAFTSAEEDNQGMLAAANNGCIFFDEVAEIPLELQAKLLRVLQEKEYIPLGLHNPVKVNAKFIFATNRNLEKMVQDGSFRKDLYYRINVIPIDVPPLRERDQDAITLFNIFYQQLCGGKANYDNSFKKSLLQYPWPGNVRELKNITERLHFNSSDKKFTSNDLNMILPTIENDEIKTNISKNVLLSTLSSVKFNQTAAAKKLNVSRMTIWRLIKKYKIK